jgi:hypothetical protein
MLNEAKRHKMGHLPGDLSKQTKITLREGRLGFDIRDESTYLSTRHAQSFRRVLKEKSITKQRQRDKKLSKLAL